MSGQGYHLALDDGQVKQILSCRDESEVVEFACQALEGLLAAKNVMHIEGGYKDWNSLLLCLTQGTYDPNGGTYPLNQCFFGGRLLVREGSIVNLVMPEAVRDVSEALQIIDRTQLRERYARLTPNKYFDHMESWAKDEQYLFDLFVKLTKLKKFYRNASCGGRSVVFYTDDPLDWFSESEDPGGLEHHSGVSENL